DFRRNKVEELGYVAFKALISLVLAAADAEGMCGQSGATILFKNLENFLPIAEGVEKRRHGADIECVRPQPELMARQPVQFGEDHPDVLGPRRCLNVEKLF